ncbi:MAG: nucleoside transporter C-terminal domain-containing protein, partial [Thermoanaerobaculia bacterium]|nr:nucleoside transporter C-terminal domain-containing protein [Thermoanaerobaculia bacterium]
MERFAALFGIVLILGIAYALSVNRRAIQWKIVGWGVLLQVTLAILILRGEFISEQLSFLFPRVSRPGVAVAWVFAVVVVAFIARRLEESRRKTLWWVFGALSAFLFLRFNLLAYVFESAREIVAQLISYTTSGAKFVFGQLGDPEASTAFIFATQVLPTIIFIASIFAILYYLGVMQVVVRFFAKIMTRFMGASGAESTNVAAAIFMGQTEAPLTIRPFLDRLTMSELMTVMTSGMATVSGGIMAAYVLVAGVDVLHLLTASIMAAPGSILLAKMMVPETEEPETGKNVHVEVPQQDVNIIDAAGRGAIEGLHLSLNVAAMLIAFLALIALIDAGFLWVHDNLLLAGAQLIDPFGAWVSTIGAIFPSSFAQFVGWIFRPIAWSMGVPWG